MLFVSILTSDRAQDPELWAVMWRGNAPPTLKLLGACNLGDNRRIFNWDADTPDDLQIHGPIEPHWGVGHLSRA